MLNRMSTTGCGNNAYKPCNVGLLVYKRRDSSEPLVGRSVISPY
jgi:hypothetical protein